MNENGCVCYILNCRGESIYPALTYISAACLRIVHPGARIVIVMDPGTAREVDGRDRRLLDLCDARIVVDVPDGFNPTCANRFLKSRLRSVIEGDFLYLDADTIPVRSLAEVFEAECDFGAAIDVTSLDRNFDVVEKTVPVDDRRIFGEFGWKCPPRRYFNGGVLFARDVPVVRCFYEDWHSRWLACQRIGFFRDQPALNAAIDESAMRVRSLDRKFNAIGAPSVRVATDVHLYHYFANKMEERSELVVPELVERYRSNDLPHCVLKRLVHTRFVWRNLHWPRLYWKSGMWFRAAYWKVRQFRNGR